MRVTLEVSDSALDILAGGKQLADYPDGNIEEITLNNVMSIKIEDHSVLIFTTTNHYKLRKDFVYNMNILEEKYFE